MSDSTKIDRMIRLGNMIVARKGVGFTDEQLVAAQMAFAAVAQSSLASDEQRERIRRITGFIVTLFESRES